MKTENFVNDEQGIAMPMALIVMVILTALMAAFAVLATSEPQIASNQMASAQARALAESGFERALWALTKGETTPGASGVILLDASENLPSPMTSPYNGTYVSVSSVGGFQVTVSEKSPVVSNEKVVTSVGYVPNSTNPIAIKKITAVVTRIKWINPVCGLCAGGEQPAGTSTQVQVGGSAAVNATTSAQGKTAAGALCSGVAPTSAVGSSGTVSTNGNPSLSAPVGGTATQNGASFPSAMLLTDSDMATLKAMAKSKGTYYQGSQDWTTPPPNGLVFVDTTDGSVLTNTSDVSKMPTVSIHGNWGAGWSGWLIVAGSIDISGNVTMSGLVYAQNDVTMHGSGGGSFSGAVISTNRRDTASTTLDSEDIGNAPISYNCPAVRDGGGQLSQNWFLKPGTYREVSGQ